MLKSLGGVVFTLSDFEEQFFRSAGDFPEVDNGENFPIHNDKIPRVFGKVPTPMVSRSPQVGSKSTTR